MRYPWVTHGVLSGHARGTQRVLTGYLGFSWFSWGTHRARREVGFIRVRPRVGDKGPRAPGGFGEVATIDGGQQHGANVDQRDRHLCGTQGVHGAQGMRGY
jgi:hypothetical protein